MRSRSVVPSGERKWLILTGLSFSDFGGLVRNGKYPEKAFCDISPVMSPSRQVDGKR